MVKHKYFLMYFYILLSLQEKIKKFEIRFSMYLQVLRIRETNNLFSCLQNVFYEFVYFVCKKMGAVSQEQIYGISQTLRFCWTLI